jgi:uncharacterized protein YjiS (DUF1127 family)
MTNSQYCQTEINCTCQGRSGQPSVSTDLRHGLGSLLATLNRWHGKSRQRQALAELDRRLLDDIGVTPSAARQEARKPFWS